MPLLLAGGGGSLSLFALGLRSFSPELWDVRSFRLAFGGELTGVVRAEMNGADTGVGVLPAIESGTSLVEALAC